MAGRQKALEILRTTVEPAADHALVAALGRSEAQNARLIAETLLARNTREAMKGLVAGWHRIERPQREQVLARDENLFGVLREVMGSSNEQSRINTVDVIREGRFYRAAYLLESALRDRSTAVRDAAARVLHALAEVSLETPAAIDAETPLPTDPDEIRGCMAEIENRREDRRQLASAIEAGLSSFDIHHQTPVIHAAMWCVDDLSLRFWKILAAPGSRAVRAAQSILSGGPDPRLIPFMMHAVHYADFRPLIAQTLANCNDATFLAQWYRQSWRVAQHKTAKGLASIREVASTKNQLNDVVTMLATGQRHFARAITAMGLPDAVKAEVLKEMHRRGEPLGRRAALWSLARLESEPRSLTLLRSIANGGDGESAWIAACELTRRRPAEYPVDALLLRRSPDTGAKQLRPEPLNPQEYWTCFESLTEDERLRWGKRLLVNTRGSEPLVNTWLASPEVDDRVRALKIVTLLDLARTFEAQVCQLCRDPDPLVRGTAVTALGRLVTHSSKRTLKTAINDVDTRVQANAIEALDRIGGVSADTELIPKLSSPDNRTRANAVMALLKLGSREAAETLLAMLDDPNRAHRISGLWLVEQLRLLPLAERIVQMAGEDADDQVRGRARSLADRLAPAESPPEPAPAHGTSPASGSPVSQEIST